MIASVSPMYDLPCCVFGLVSSTKIVSKKYRDLNSHF